MTSEVAYLLEKFITESDKMILQYRCASYTLYLAFHYFLILNVNNTNKSITFLDN